MDQIKLIEADPNMVVIEVTKHGNFLCVDKSLLHEETWVDDTKTTKSGKTRLCHLREDPFWKKHHAKLREAGIDI